MKTYLSTISDKELNDLAVEYFAPFLLIPYKRKMNQIEKDRYISFQECASILRAELKLRNGTADKING